MAGKILVGDVMSRSPISVPPKTHLLDCARKMIKSRVDSILIIENKKLIGIITQKDILWAIIKKSNLDLKSVKAADIATRKIAVISPGAALPAAFQKMKKLGFRRLPVLLRGKIVGLLTIKDILKIDPSYYSKASELLDLRKEKSSHESSTDELGGFCDNCGSFADLVKAGNRMLCPDCRDEH